MKTGARDSNYPGAWGKNIWALYLGTVISLIIGGMLLRFTSPLADCGGSRYEWRARWRVVGKVFLAIAALCLLAGAMGQLINLRHA